MKNILQHLEAFGEFEIIIFGNEVILNEPVDKWPICDCLISFFSSGFPLSKAEEYAQLRKPFLLNDIAFQKNLLNREKVSFISPLLHFNLYHCIGVHYFGTKWDTHTPACYLSWLYRISLPFYYYFKCGYYFLLSMKSIQNTSRHW